MKRGLGARKLFDWLESHPNLAIVSNNEGRWAIAEIAVVPMMSEPADATLVYYVREKDWKLTLSWAIRYAMAREEKCGKESSKV